MANLTAAKRRKMPAKSFAGPGKSFPVNDKTHARLAIGGATRAERAGNISEAQEAKIKATARAKLGDSKPKPKANPRQGAKDGLGRGKGGVAVHESLAGANIHNDKPMRHESY